MKLTRRNTVLAAAAALALALVSATPAFAASASGYRSCTSPKSVTLSTVMQGTSGNHYYAVSNQMFNFTNPSGAAYAKQTYGSPAATNWSVYSSGPLNYYNAGCD